MTKTKSRPLTRTRAADRSNLMRRTSQRWYQRMAILPHDVEQPIEIERLLQEHVRIEASGVRLIERGQDDDRERGEPRIPLLLVAEFASGRVAEPFEGQQFGHHLAKIRVVFDNEDRAVAVGREHVGHEIG